MLLYNFFVGFLDLNFGIPEVGDWGLWGWTESVPWSCGGENSGWSCGYTWIPRYCASVCFSLFVVNA